MYWSQYLDGAGYSIANVRDSVGNSAANVENVGADATDGDK